MNDYNQDRNKIGSFAPAHYKNQGNDDPFRLLVKRYLSDVEDVMIDILRKEKNMSEKEASDFTGELFTLGNKRENDIANEVEDCYSDGMTKKQCAEKLLNKYYRITKNNKYINKPSYQQNRNLSGDGEVTEVDERKRYDEYKHVSNSLFWNFINRISDLGLKFKLDTSYIKNIPNSLNTKGYMLFMETSKINNSEVEYEFKYNKILSNILQYISGKDTQNETSFYIGFDHNSELHFGFCVNNKRYKIGYIDYTTSDFQKLIPYIDADNEIDLYKLSNKFLSNIQSLHNANLLFLVHLENYDDDVEIHNVIINSQFGIMIESLNNEVINKNYLIEIINKSIKMSQHTKWYLEELKGNKKTVYYFILK